MNLGRVERLAIEWVRVTNPPIRIFLSCPHMGGGELERINEVFEQNWVAPAGPAVSEFERGLAKLTGLPHVAALSSGTAALHLALRLCGVTQGDEVWGSTMTFIGGVAPILYLGAVPVFLDVAGDDFLVDLDILEEQLKAARKPPKVVITTDLYGHVVDGQRVRALADRYGFKWISDAAEAVGSYRNGLHAGDGADFAVYSFNGNKIITTSGGGALASKDGEAIEAARFLSTQARHPAAHYEHQTYGYNYRLSGVCAAIGSGQLTVLSDRVEARRRIHKRYRDSLGDMDGIAFSPEPPSMRANRWLTTILVDPKRAGFDRETLRLALLAKGIESRPLWKPMHLQPVFSGARAIGGAIAAEAFRNGLCLPSGSAMSDSELDEVIEVVRSAGTLSKLNTNVPTDCSSVA
jgi:dTDP-4-amino-4,6-dideoxygalactose transaminase